MQRLLAVVSQAQFKRARCCVCQWRTAISRGNPVKKMTYKIAVIQMNSQYSQEENIAQATRLIEDAVAQGAQFIATPEVTNRCVAANYVGNEPIEQEAHHSVLKSMTSLAKHHEVYLLLGSLTVALQGTTKLANRSYLIDPSGSIIGSYDKLHMFDVPSLNGEETYEESRRIQAGSEAVLVRTKRIGDIGMTVCYDMRFPYLYRKLAQAGAEVITVPSAFTVVTGEAHWKSLLRARAIENGCFIIAPAQGGDHPGGRRTYGRSMVVDPFGKVLAFADHDYPCVLLANINLDAVHHARTRIPSLSQDKSFVMRIVEATTSSIPNFSTIPLQKERFVIYHNPKCNKSCAALQLLQKRLRLSDFRVVEYLTEPLNRAQLTDVVRKLISHGIALQSIVRPDAPNLSNVDELVELVLSNPAMLERPIVIDYATNVALIVRPTTEKLLDLLSMTTSN